MPGTGYPPSTLPQQLEYTKQVAADRCLVRHKIFAPEKNVKRASVEAEVQEIAAVGRRACSKGKHELKSGASYARDLGLARVSALFDSDQGFFCDSAHS